MADNNSAGTEAEETVDDLLLGGLKVIQSRSGYRFSIDAVLLANFIDANQAIRVTDLGTGSGVIALLLYWRLPYAQITGIEIQPDMYNRAERSLQLNHCTDRIRIMAGDIRHIDQLMALESMDLVVSNPPYYGCKEGKISLNQEKAIARHEICMDLSDLISAARYLLKPQGRFAFIQPARRLPSLQEILAQQDMSLKRVRMVHSFRDRAPSMVLVEAEKEGTGPAVILEPLVIYQSPGVYSEEILQIYRGQG
ncbi:MAG: tRNA1(Val) (adenine(37)-N6)-methyltransferase [Syntrophomonadaceae bacterium]|nr:tRNA1(Val) (adenine(37)-N6)-methyltransferase [Syntrophomonadaceae bacterium]